MPSSYNLQIITSIAKSVYVKFTLFSDIKIPGIIMDIRI